jgi:type IV secretory pathway VirB10-like protein
MPPPAAPAKSQPAKTTHPAAPATGSTTTTTQQTPPAAPAPAGAPTPVFDMVAIPEGKNITVILDQGLSSKTGQAGQMISGTVKKDVQTRDHPMPIIPAGSVISGQIIEVQKASQMKGQAKLVVRFDTLKLTTGKTLPIVASIGAQGADTSSRTAAGIAGGAVAGAILGRIIGKDTKGTVIGAVAGGAIGTGVVMGLDN